MIIRTDDNRRIKCRPDAIGPGWGSAFEVWGRRWDASNDRWTAKDNLYYVNAYTVETENKTNDQASIS